MISEGVSLLTQFSVIRNFGCLGCFQPRDLIQVSDIRLHGSDTDSHFRGLPLEVSGVYEREMTSDISYPRLH